MSIMKYEQRFFIHTRALDSQDNFKPSGILDYFQDIAGVHAEKINVGYDVMKEKNLAWVILGASFEITDEKFEIMSDINVTTWPKVPGKIECEREYEIKTQDGRLIANGLSLWCLIDIDKRTIARASNASFVGEYYDYTRYPNGITRKLNININNPDQEYKYIVEASDIDHNGHLNNARYLDLIQNMMGLNRKIKKCDMAFIHEVRFKEEIRVIHQTIDGIECYKGYVNDTLSFECMATIKETK